MRDLPKGTSVQVVKKSTRLSMFDIYANPINKDNEYESGIKLTWNVVEYGKDGQPATAKAKAYTNFETATKIAHDILGGHPFAAKLSVLSEVERDLDRILSRINGKADKDVKRMIIENALGEAIAKAYLYPNRIRETWEYKEDNQGNPYYRYTVSGGGKGKTMLESRYLSIEAREYNKKLQYHVITAVTEGQRGRNGAVTPVPGKHISRAKTIVDAKEMCEAMEKLLLFIQGSVNYDVAKGTYRPFTINSYHAINNQDQNINNQGQMSGNQNEDPPQRKPGNQNQSRGNFAS